MGRKKKRETALFATKVLRLGTSLRGLAELNDQSPNAPRRRFHRSIRAWKRSNLIAPPFTEEDGKLILIVDGIYFQFKDEEYVCLIVLLRPVEERKARFRGLILVQGDESRKHWEKAFKSALTHTEQAQICAVVADGAHGLVSLSNEQKWVYQRCHFHLLKEFKNICGGHRGVSRDLREMIVDVIRQILDTPDEKETKLLVEKLISLIAHPDCPRTVKNKVNGFLKHIARFRMCYQYPELRLPKTSNSAEYIGKLIRRRENLLHGFPTTTSLEYWLEIILRENPEIRCV